MTEANSNSSPMGEGVEMTTTDHACPVKDCPYDGSKNNWYTTTSYSIDGTPATEAEAYAKLGI